MLDVSKQIARKNNGIVLSQYENEENINAHFTHTSNDLLKNNIQYNYFAAGIGTGGTIIGISKRLKKLYNVTTYGVVPMENESISGLLFDQSTLIKRYKAMYIDKVILVATKEAKEQFRKMNENGYPVGLSTGAVISTIKSINTRVKNQVILGGIMADTNMKYLSLI